MIELATTLIANGVIAGLLIYSIKRSDKRSDSQEKALTMHIINYTKETTGRPTFSETDERIDKAKHEVCKKTNTLSIDFKKHHHESRHGAVVLGV